jgi:hypothetical protein
MENIINKPLQQPKKKISLDIEGSILEVVDKLVEITKSSRTQVIETIIGLGYPLLIGNLKSSWTTLLSQDISEEKKKNIKKLLTGINKLITTNPK